MSQFDLKSFFFRECVLFFLVFFLPFYFFFWKAKNLARKNESIKKCGHDLSLFLSPSLSLHLYVHIYIYVYVWRVVDHTQGVEIWGSETFLFLFFWVFGDD